jgi:hypothetical protein
MRAINNKLTGTTSFSSTGARTISAATLSFALLDHLCRHANGDQSYRKTRQHKNLFNKIHYPIEQIPLLETSVIEILLLHRV